MTRFILKLNRDEDALLALRAAKSLLESEYQDCVYGYPPLITMYAKRNKASISVTQLRP